MRQTRLALACVLATILAGCGPKGPASVAGGECQIFKAEIVSACGLTSDDQRVIDENAEAGLAACHWTRPQPRAPSCEQMRHEIAELRNRNSVVAKVPAKKKGVVQRAREAIKF